MIRTLFVDTIKEVIYEGEDTFIKNQIECAKANYQRDNINFVFGKDYLFNRNVYFIYDIEKGFSKIELEEKVENYLVEMHNFDRLSLLDNE